MSGKHCNSLVRNVIGLPDRPHKQLFEIITGRTFVDSFLADRISVMTDLKAILGLPPAKWLGDLDCETRDALSKTEVRNMALDRYFQLNYDHDDSQLLEAQDEEEILIEVYEKPRRELSDAQLNALSRLLSILLSYETASRGTPETLQNALQSALQCKGV